MSLSHMIYLLLYGQQERICHASSEDILDGMGSNGETWPEAR